MNSKQFVMLLSISVIVFALFAGGCSKVTTYGHEPEQVAINKNIYEFSIFLNAFATKEDCDVKVKEEADKFMKKHNYDRYTILDSRDEYLRAFPDAPYKYVYRIDFFPLNKE